MGDGATRVKKLREKLQAGERGGDDADVLMEFSDRLQLLKSEYSDYRHAKLLRHCCRMAENVGGLEASLTDREATERIVRWINDTYDNPETNRDYRVAIRAFGKHVTEGDEIPESIEWVPGSTPSSYNPTPNPAEMLAWEADVRPMVETAPNARDAALIALQFDAGLRSGELQDLQRGDVTSGDHGLRVRVDGRRGERTVTLIPSVPWVQRWTFEHHPAPSDSTAPLWSKLGSPEPISYRRLADVFKQAGRRADVSKPVTPTNFRKSNATWLAKRGAKAPLIEDRQGRKRGSEAIARYVARFGEESEERQYASLHGVDVEQTEPADVRPTECPRCGKETPPTQPVCVWCGQALDPESAELIDRARRAVRDVMIRADDPDVIQTAAETLNRLESSPEDAAQIISRFEPDHDESSPNSIS